MGRNSKRGAWPNLRQKSTGSAANYYSDSFKAHAKRNPGLLKSLHSAVLKSASMIGYGEVVSAEGFTIKRIWKGDAGRSNAKLFSTLSTEPAPKTGTFLVSKGKKNFFVKVTDSALVPYEIHRLRKLQKFFDARGGKMNGFNLKTVNLQAVRISPAHGIVVSDFINHEKVKTFDELDKRKQRRISALFSKLTNDGVGTTTLNMFYEPATNTIIVFDGE